MVSWRAWECTCAECQWTGTQGSGSWATDQDLGYHVQCSYTPLSPWEARRWKTGCFLHRSSILECRVLQYLYQRTITAWASGQNKWVWMQIVGMNSFKESKLCERYRKSGSSCHVYVSNVRALMRSWKKALSHLWGLHGVSDGLSLIAPHTAGAVKKSSKGALLTFCAEL